MQYFLVLLLAVGGMGCATAPLIRNSLVMNYCLVHEDWHGLLSEAARRPPAHFSAFHSHIVNRALYHTGMLLEEMLRYPQDAATLLLAPKQTLINNKSIYKHVWLGPTYLELGLVNYADHLADEALAYLPHFPEGLKLQALVYMAKGMPDAAAVYLKALRRDRLYRVWADARIKKIEDNADCTDDSLIRHYRSIMLELDTPITDVPILYQLAAQPRDRMVFEYVTAVYLLHCNLDALIDGVRWLRHFHYPHIPRLYEEALLMYMITQNKEPELFGYTIREDTQRRFNEATALFSRHGGDKEKALTPMARSFGDSYLFFYLYGKTGCMVP